MSKTPVTRPLTAAAINTLTRACITAPPGHVLAVCDFSQVEARALQWAAGDHEGLKVFHLFDSGDKVNGDPYRAMAAEIYGKTPAEIGKESVERKVGKAAELACLGADTPVLTSRGAVPITSICDSDLLWDGQEWVSHKGLVFRGFRETIKLACVDITPDHLVLCGSQWEEAGNVSGPTLRQALDSASGIFRSWQLWSAHVAGRVDLPSSVPVEHRHIPLTPATYDPGEPQGAIDARSASQERPPSTIGATPRFYPTTGTADACSTGSQPWNNAARTHATRLMVAMAAAAFAFGQGGCATGRTFFDTWLPFRVGTCRSTTSTEPTTTADTSPGTCASFRTPSTKVTSGRSEHSPHGSPNLRPVYDLAHAGPRNRFTILTSEGPLIVHNCGYGQGAGGEAHPMTGKPFGFYGFSVAMGCDWQALAPLTAKSVVDKWRETHHPIVAFWKELEQAAMTAVDGIDCAAGPFEYLNCDGLVVCRLPSGRAVVYRGLSTARDERNRPTLVYQSRKGREKTYGGKLAENAIQAMCRDLMARALVEAEAEGLCPVLTIHDEIICQVPEREAKAALGLLHSIMCEVPGWASGMPIAAAGHVCERYHK